ncbi:hypothetical protein K9N68_37395 (plasmid) [Kovacikia minuta CCNUW1]|uniref:hypothetical protein n=1 Tax=Kovacikia minuta TaxID=2931930 RepID=UPI001CCFB2F2|nr:hypothetical protein [Kovacikia minuta]UBF29889.1 hypothetical protein K9N68_37395 [Kovacikia minuta CCNUW1]
MKVTRKASLKVGKELYEIQIPQGNLKKLNRGTNVLKQLIRKFVRRFPRNYDEWATFLIWFAAYVTVFGIFMITIMQFALRVNQLAIVNPWVAMGIQIIGGIATGLDGVDRFRHKK